MNVDRRVLRPRIEFAFDPSPKPFRRFWICESLGHHRQFLEDAQLLRTMRAAWDVLRHGRVQFGRQFAIVVRGQEFPGLGAVHLTVPNQV